MAEHEEGIPQVITFLASLLQQVSESNDLLSDQSLPSSVSVFHGLVKPTISIQSYLERIFKYSHCSPSCYVVAYVYLDRFCQRHPSFPLDSFNVHRLLITSVLVSIKFMDDVYYNNAYYAKIGGISTREMNVLELEFLFSLGFNLSVTPNTFHSYIKYLKKDMVFRAYPQVTELPARPLKDYSCCTEDETTPKQLTA